MAPWGGTEPLLGTNPIAVAIPAGNEAPVVFDIATSVASNGAIRTHQLEGRPMPEGWVQSRKDGSPITDPSRITEGTYRADGRLQGLGPLARASGCSPDRSTAPPSGATSTISRRRRRASSMSGSSWSRSTSRASCRSTCSRPRSTATSATSRRRKRLPGVDEIRVPGQGRARAPQRARGERRAAGAALVTQVDEVAKSLGVTPLQRARMTTGETRTTATPASQGSPFWRFSLRFYRQPQVGRCLHRAAGAGRRRRQSAAVPAVAREPRAHVLDRRGRGARAPRSVPGAT